MYQRLIWRVGPVLKESVGKGRENLSKLGTLVCLFVTRPYWFRLPIRSAASPAHAVSQGRYCSSLVVSHPSRLSPTAPCLALALSLHSRWPRPLLVQPPPHRSFGWITDV